MERDYYQPSRSTCANCFAKRIKYTLNEYIHHGEWFLRGDSQFALMNWFGRSQRFALGKCLETGFEFHWKLA